jgi:hypothetical protein
VLVPTNRFLWNLAIVLAAVTCAAAAAAPAAEIGEFTDGGLPVR